MSRGHVYILSNPSMPDIIKVGMTTRSVEQRANELWQTGVPTPFKIEESFFTPDCSDMEATFHSFFEPFRVSTSREFFKMGVADASVFLRGYLRSQIAEFVSEFDESVTLVDELHHIDESVLERLADDMNSFPHEVAQMFYEISPADMVGPEARYREKCRLRGIRLKAGIGLGSLNQEDIDREISEKDGQCAVRLVQTR